MKKGPFIFWSVFIAAAIFRVSQTFSLKSPNIGPCVKQVVVGSGVLSEEPERKETGQVLVVLVDALSIASSTTPCATDFLIRMKTKLYPRFGFGDHVNFKGKLLKPMNFSNKADPGRSFDYEGYLAKSDIFYEMKSAEVSTRSIIGSVTDTGGVVNGQDDSSGGEMGRMRNLFGNAFSSIASQLNNFLFSIKRRFVSNLEKTLGEPHAALASGLVVGEKAALGTDLLNDFRTVGLIHVVVLSGYNITIVGDAMRRMLVFLPRLWGISIGGIGIALFGILVGGGATVVRSCFMAGIALSADIIRRDYDVSRSLIFAGLIMLIQSPVILLHDPSFQLSFLATMGLILLASPIEKRLRFIPDKFGMRGIVASTVATQIFVSPYILYMMGNLSIIGMVVNILVLPFIPITMLFVFVTGSVGMLSIPVAHVFAWGTHLLLSYELVMVENFARLPFASIHLPAFSKWWVVGFYVVFALVYWGKGVFSVIDRVRSIEKLIEKPDLQTFDYIYRQFQSLPKNVLVDRPQEYIKTNFELNAAVIRLFHIKERAVMFTRRTLKHLAEKSTTSLVNLEQISESISQPSCIYRSDNERRWLVSRLVVIGSTQRNHVVVLEKIDGVGFVVVTSFIANQKYLKNFEILWRTATS